MISLDSLEITVDGDFSHEIRRGLLGRKAITNSMCVFSHFQSYTKFVTIT